MTTLREAFCLPPPCVKSVCVLLEPTAGALLLPVTLISTASEANVAPLAAMNVNLHVTLR
jgi:hypothetical protein